MTAEQKDRAKTTRMLKKYASETSWILRIYRDAMSFMTDEEYMTEYGYNPRVSDKVKEYLFNGEWNGTPEFANCFDYARSLLPERYWDDESESIPMIADIVARIGSRLAEETMTQTQAVEVAQPEAMYNDDTYSDFSGDNSAQEQDIPECHEPDATPAPVNLEEIYAETEQFEKMPVSEKMKYLKAIAEIYHSQPIHDDYYGLDCGFYDLFRHCTVNELEEIARISGVKIPASVYVDKGVLDINLQWYVNVKVFGVDTTPTELDYVKDADYWSETPEKAKANNNPAMLYDWLEAEIENYECGKLTAEEMSEIVKYAPLGTLRTYARMNEIAPLMSNDEREGLKRAITARIFLPADNISKNEGEITAMLNKYAENRATRRAILDGVRFFRREIKKRTEKRLSSEKLPDAILSVKGEYRRLRLEGFQLRRKLLRVICAEEISQACAKYIARCREIQRRHTGK